RISAVHGTLAPVDPETGAESALVYALYHPAAALRSSEVERQSFADVAGIPAALTQARQRRQPAAAPGFITPNPGIDPAADAAEPPTLF
ncbi:MAG TPA: hypothetical protein VNH13_09480, partial [Candidatus Acidoferrales bacterium]|nr:hypothetical protein [Candidatus Acidoferrales bacterium]